VKSRLELLGSQCRPVASGTLSEGEIAAQLSVLPEWKLAGGAITRTYRFRDYYETMAFVNALARVVHAEDHHPELVVGFDRCEVRFSTHSVGGVSGNDFICAAKADAILVQRATPPAA